MNEWDNKIYVDLVNWVWDCLNKNKSEKGRDISFVRASQRGKELINKIRKSYLSENVSFTIWSQEQLAQER